jgi:phage-related protein
LTEYNNIVILPDTVWNIEYYQSEAGRSPVSEFIDSLEVTAKARVARTLDLLEEFGIELGMPYVRHLEKHLWELRIRQSRNRYSIIYFLADGQTFVLLHGFSKKTGPVPRPDIEIAKRRCDDYLMRRRK